jgi:beta-N-acetylhexosaminidase
MVHALLLLILALSLQALDIVDRPIPFGSERIELTRSYIAEHYGIDAKSIAITPRIIVVHATGIDNLDDSMARFVSERLPTDRPDITNGGALNVSAHFMVDFDGTIYRLMDETAMARHVIGLNYSSIGIENVGGGSGDYSNLTEAQLEANRKLIAYLLDKYPTITHLIGHHEYLCMESTPLWLERDPNYRTRKTDPGAAFIHRLRDYFNELETPPCGTKHD